MSGTMNAQDILDREFFEMRAKILQLGASLDRMKRADGTVESDPKMNLIQHGIQILLDEKTEKAERIQLLFSREYSEDWKTEFKID